MTQMLTAFETPPPSESPAIDRLVTEPPELWQELPLDWKKRVTPKPVYVAQYTVPVADQIQVLYLFGSRYDLEDVLVAGESLGEGYFLEYSVAWQDGTGTWTVVRLLQRASVPYSDVDERQDYAPVERVRDPMSLSVLTPPRWEDVDEAVWPLFRDKPMRFVGQVSLPENQTTRQFLSWGLTVYLFYAVDDAGIRCKVIEQRAGTQSLEGHYREEERQ